jgi:hypothetical protein
LTHFSSRIIVEKLAASQCLALVSTILDCFTKEATYSSVASLFFLQSCNGLLGCWVSDYTHVPSQQNYFSS